MRNPLHAICPYFAVFPEDFVATQVLTHTQPSDLVLDPFCGRGTTLLESLLHFRRAIGTDVNPVAACITSAKIDPPDLQEMLEFISGLEYRFENYCVPYISLPEFFAECFHEKTLQQVLFLRQILQWRTHPLDRFAAAMMLGCLHGESHRSSLYLSNRMPRTISTKPAYSVEWWRKNNCVAPHRNAFGVLRRLSVLRLTRSAPPLTGVAKMADVRNAAACFPEHLGEVRLVLTSPPYFDVTDYGEDQWLRLWFLGGPPEPVRNLHPDSRHRDLGRYWEFLSSAWSGILPLLHEECTIAVRIGGRLSKESLGRGLLATLKAGLPECTTVPCYSSSTEIGNGQVQSFRPGVSKHGRAEHDFTYRLRRSRAPGRVASSARSNSTALVDQD